MCIRDRGTHGLTGLNQADLEQLGAEIGIDPAYVAEALRQRARSADPAEAPRGGVFGGPACAVSERTLPAPLTDDLWTDIAEGARRLTRAPGRTEMAGNGRVWRGTKTTVTATPVRDGTRVHIERRTSETGAAILGVSMGVVLLFAMLAAMGYALAGLGVGVAALVVTFLAARFAYGRHVRGVWQDSEALLDRLEVAALRTAAPSPRLTLPTDETPDATARASGDRLRTGA